MKVLALTRYSRLGASSRLRFLQFFPALKLRGVDVVAEALFTDDYVANLSAARTDVRGVINSYARRLKVTLGRQKFDVIWIEKELFPWFPDWLEKLCSQASSPYVVDYDDAIFHRYDSHSSGFVRRLLGKKIDRVMARASSVVVGNEYLGERAIRAGAARVVYIPTVIDPARYGRSERESHEFRIGWIGSPSTTPYLSLIATALARVAASMPTRVILIGATEVALPAVSVEYREWNEDREAADIAEFDVGVMPLLDRPWERGKCGYKLLQYMGASKPVVASPVGVNCQIVADGYNGFLARDAGEWGRALMKLGEGTVLRQEMGTRGRTLVEDKYSIEAVADRLADTLKMAASMPS